MSMYEILLAFFLVISVTLIVLTILQQNRGTNIGNSFGVSTSGLLLDSNTSDKFITKMIIVLAILFFIISLTLGNVNSHKSEKTRKWHDLKVQERVEKIQQICSNKINNSDIPK